MSMLCFNIAWACLFRHLGMPVPRSGAAVSYTHLQVRCNLKTDKQKMIAFLKQQIAEQDEAYLRSYRENLPHL